MRSIGKSDCHSSWAILMLALAAWLFWCGESAAIDADDAHIRFFSDASGSIFGHAVAAGGDFNGDGRQDVIVGDYLEDKAYIFFGPPSDAAVPINWNASFADVQLMGEPLYGGGFGFSVAWAGDFNRDGYDDVLIGAPYGAYSSTTAGNVYLFFGGPYESDTTLIAWEADRTFIGEEPWDKFGWSVAGAGQFNDDEYSDIVIGAPGANWPPPYDNDNGIVYVFHGDDRAGPLDVTANYMTDMCTHGKGDTDDQLGFCVAGAGDFNGDGLDEIIAGSPYASDYSDSGRFPGMIEVIGNAGVLFSLYGRREVDAFGFSVAGIGDFNGDTFADIAVGAPNAPVGQDLEWPGAGRAYIVLGRAESLTDQVVERDSGGIYALLGEDEYDAFGYSVGGAGDFNGDRQHHDVVIGAPGNMDIPTAILPKAYVFIGRDVTFDAFINYDMRTASSYSFVGTADNHRFGCAVDGGFDWYGVAAPKDIVIGAFGNDSAYLFLGAYYYNWPQYHRSLPISIQNNTHKLAKASPFYRQSFDPGGIGFYFMEPGPGTEQQPRFWGAVPLAVTIAPGKSVSLSVALPTCDQGASEKTDPCSQPSDQAHIYWSFKTTINGRQLYAFPEDTPAPPSSPSPPPMSVALDGASEKQVQLVAFDHDGTRVGGAKIFNLAPVLAGVNIKPSVIHLNHRGGRIKCTINLPDGYNEKLVEPESLLLSDPACQACRSIRPIRGKASKHKYTAFFSRAALVDLIKTRQMETGQMRLRISGHLKFGNRFEGDALVKVRRHAKKRIPKKRP